MLHNFSDINVTWLKFYAKLTVKYEENLEIYKKTKNKNIFTKKFIYFITCCLNKLNWSTTPMTARNELNTAVCIELSIFDTDDTAFTTDSIDWKAPRDDSKTIKKKI